MEREIKVGVHVYCLISKEHVKAHRKTCPKIYFCNHKLCIFPFDYVKEQKKRRRKILYTLDINKHLTASENIKASVISKCGGRTVSLTVDI